MLGTTGATDPTRGCAAALPDKRERRDEAFVAARPDTGELMSMGVRRVASGPASVGVGDGSAGGRWLGASRCVSRRVGGDALVWPDHARDHEVDAVCAGVRDGGPGRACHVAFADVSLPRG